MVNDNNPVRIDYTLRQSLVVFSGTEGFAQLQRELASLSADATILIVTSAGHLRRESLQPLLASLSVSQEVKTVTVSPNPELSDLDALHGQLQSLRPDVVIGFGGGSAIDAAKVLAAVLNQEPEPLSRSFRAQQSLNLSRDCLLVAIPTTAGTGAEATPFATVWDAQSDKKFSLSHQFVVPDIAVLAPELTLELPYQETLFSGLDTLSHSLESLWNRHQTPLSQAYARQAFTMVCENLPQVLEDGYDRSARALLQQASFLAGLAIAQTRTAIAHSMSYPVTLAHGVPHGLACSYTLPGVMHVLTATGEQWWPGMVTDFKQARALLKSLDLATALQQYTSWQDVMVLLPKMISKERAGNFVLPIDDELLAQVLRESERFYAQALA